MANFIINIWNYRHIILETYPSFLCACIIFSVWIGCIRAQTFLGQQVWVVSPIDSSAVAKPFSWFRLIIGQVDELNRPKYLFNNDWFIIIRAVFKQNTFNWNLGSSIFLCRNDLRRPGTTHNRVLLSWRKCTCHHSSAPVNPNYKLTSQIRSQVIGYVSKIWYQRKIRKLTSSAIMYSLRKKFDTENTKKKYWKKCSRERIPI